MSYEQRVKELGLEIPDFGTPGKYYGQQYGKMAPYYRYENLLFLSGHVPDLHDGSDPPRVLYPGKLGRDVTVEQAYEAARVTGLNCLAGIRQAVGSLDNVKALVRTLNFVVCDAEFTDPNLISSGTTDLFAEVFGEEAGVAPRATIGVTSLANNHCFETWMTLEVR